MSLNSILEGAIKRSGGLKPPKLGPKKLPEIRLQPHTNEVDKENFENLSLTEEVKDLLIKELKKQSEFNNQIIIIIIVAYFILFGLAIFVVIYYRDSPTVIAIVLGGSVLSLLGVITSMKQLLREKHIMDLVRVTIPNLSPDQAMIAIQSIYYNEKNQGK